MAFTEILYEKDGPVLTISLNRPEALNAWTRVMEGEEILMMAPPVGEC